MCALIKLLFTEHEEPSRRGSRLSISLFLHLWSRLPYMQRGEKLLCCYLHRRYLHSDFEKVHSADENSLFFHLFAFSFFALRDFSPTSLSFFLLVCFTFPPPPEEQSVQAALRGRFWAHGWLEQLGPASCISSFLWFVECALNFCFFYHCSGLKFCAEHQTQGNLTTCICFDSCCAMCTATESTTLKSLFYPNKDAFIKQKNKHMSTSSTTDVVKSWKTDTLIADLPKENYLNSLFSFILKFKYSSRTHIKNSYFPWL